MSLIKREVTPAMAVANRANSLHSTGPRSERGKAIASRNLLRPRPFSEIVAHNLEILGELPGDFEQMHKALSAAMAPRDEWEVAWIQDIAILRWRLERLQRAEVGILAVRKRQLANERRRASMPATGRTDLLQRQQIAASGFTSLPDSPWKFQQVIQFLDTVRKIIRLGDFEKDSFLFFDMLYGKYPGAQGAVLRGRFEGLAQLAREGKFQEGCHEQRSLMEAVEQEIANYEQKQALYAAEHAEDDPAQADADLLLPQAEMDAVIRLETHLEDQIERKLRQFYARRRESGARSLEDLPLEEEPAPAELAHAAAAVGQ